MGGEMNLVILEKKESATGQVIALYGSYFKVAGMTTLVDRKLFSSDNCQG